jgi:hypothetical protein
MSKELQSKERGGPARAVAVVSAALLMVLVTGGNAFAQAADPATVAAIDNGFAGLKGLVTGTLAIALFGIVVAVLGIVMGVKWLRKGATT